MTLGAIVNSLLPEESTVIPPSDGGTVIPSSDGGTVTPPSDGPAVHTGGSLVTSAQDAAPLWITAGSVATLLGLIATAVALRRRVG